MSKEGERVRGRAYCKLDVKLEFLRGYPLTVDPLSEGEGRVEWLRENSVLRVTEGREVGRLGLL